MTESNKPGSRPVTCCASTVRNCGHFSAFADSRSILNKSGKSFIQLVGELDKNENTGCTSSDFSESKQLNSSPLINVIRLCIMTRFKSDIMPNRCFCFSL